MSLRCLAGLALVMAAMPARAEPVELTYLPEVGSTRDYSVKVQGEVRVGESGAVPLDCSVPVRVHVAERVEDEPLTRLRMVLGKATVVLDGQRLPWRLGGAGYTAERDLRGRLVDVSSRAPAMAARTGDFAALFHDVRCGLVLPEEPVEVGDTWTVHIEDEPFIFEPQRAERRDRSVKGELVCELTDFRRVGEVPVAEIHLKLNLRTKSEAGAVTLRQEMDLALDARTGMVIRGEGDLSLALTAPSGTRTVFENLEVQIRRAVDEPREEEAPDSPEDTDGGDPEQAEMHARAAGTKQ
jgi:hypothetical protein